MKFYYYEETIQIFVKKHPRNFNQLFHMVWAGHTSYTNLAILTFLFQSDNIEIVVNEYRLNGIDIGTSVDAALKYCKKSYKLPEKYHAEANRLLKELEAKDKNIADKIQGEINKRGLTWGIFITLLVQEHITLALETATLLSEGRGIDKQVTLLTANGVQLVNAYQNAGNKPISISKGIKIWNEHDEQFVAQIKARIAGNNLEATKIYNALQLHSFAMANFFVKATI